MANWNTLQKCLKMADERPDMRCWYIGWAKQYAWKIERFFYLKELRKAREKTVVNL